MKNFPAFWFESNLYFGMVNDLDDLQLVFIAYKDHMTKDEILDKAVNKDETLDEFGLRREHKGDVTLRKFLTDKGIKI
jgi:hypothetical protein